MAAGGDAWAGLTGGSNLGTLNPMRACLLLLLTLAGCAERWERPGTSEAVSEANHQQCVNLAAQAVPPRIITRLASPARVERSRDCRREGDRERCRETERYIPERYEDVDLNAGARDGHRQRCMTSRGFRFTGYRPLRLE